MNTTSSHSDFEQLDKQKRCSFNREMKSHQRNTAEDKLLELSNTRLDKIIDREARNVRNTTRELKQEQETINKRSLPADVWLRKHEPQYQAWKEREREKLLRKHKTMMKSYRTLSEDLGDVGSRLSRSKSFVSRDSSPTTVLPRRGSVTFDPVTISVTIPKERKGRSSRRHTVSAANYLTDDS